MLTPSPLMLKRIARYVLAPLLLYLVFFALYTWPWLPNFSTHYFADAGDGLQNAWNLWWAHKALTGSDALYFTTYLHAPEGTSLLGHTLTPINGLIGTGLQSVFSLVQTYNLLVISSFVGAGLTAFWLCYGISKSYLGSLLGGFAFTFSSYHFAHAIGHMNLITLQFVPLFLLAWWHLLRSPSSKMALWAALALAPVVLSDLYYLMYCIIAAVIMAAFHLKQISWRPLLLFVLLSIVFVAPLPIAVLWHNHVDPLIGGHDPSQYAANLLSPFIAGEMWRFNSLTQWFWSRENLDIVEGSVSLPFVLLGAVITAIAWRKKLPARSMTWAWLGLIFAILSFGPYLHVFRHVFTAIPLPYLLLIKIFPFLALAGVTIRMLIIAQLAAAVLLSLVIAQIKLDRPWSKPLLAGLFIILIFECWPATLPLTPALVPEYALKLKDLPPGLVIDQLNTDSDALYAQTIHEHPLASGYLARLSISVITRDEERNQLIADQKFAELNSRFGFRYLIQPASNNRLTGLAVLYDDNGVIIYDLSPRQIDNLGVGL